MQFDEIFQEYYVLYRGQAKIPAVGESEYNIAIQLANNAIRKWARADGTLWRELFSTNVDGGGDSTFSNGTTEYSGPSDMRKPGGIIMLGDIGRFKTIDAQEIADVVRTGPVAYFTGGANTGYTLHLSGNLEQYDSAVLDYVYYKNPTMITSGSIIPDMSDPNFMIQDMLASRFQNSRNSFGYENAKDESNAALQNMIIENNSGTPGQEWSVTDDNTTGFGISDIW